MNDEVKECHRKMKQCKTTTTKVSVSLATTRLFGGTVLVTCCTIMVCITRLELCILCIIVSNLCLFLSHLLYICDHYDILLNAMMIPQNAGLFSDTHILERDFQISKHNIISRREN